MSKQPASSNSMANGTSRAGTSESSHFRDTVTRICSGSEEAMWEFIECYGEHMHRYVRKKLDPQSPLRVRFDSVDFVQMVWASFFTNSETLAKFESPTAVAQYLVAMARNKLVSELRRAQGPKAGDIRRTCRLEKIRNTGNEPASKGETPSYAVMIREQAGKVLEECTERDREIVAMRALGKSFAEIAAELRINERTARRAIHRLLGENARQLSSR